MPVDVSDEYDRTALHLASMLNQTDVIKHLLHEGANMKRQDRFFKDTPLHEAALYNKAEAAQILIETGAGLNLIDNFKKTALNLARKGSVVERLLMQFQ